MLRKILFVVFFMTLSPLAMANPIRKLWVAIEGDVHGQCKGTVDGFLSCMLNDTNFRSGYLDSYPNGVDLVLGGTKTIGTGCGLYGFQCAVDQAGFAVADDDVLIYVGGASYCSGGENQRGRTVVVNGKTVHPRTGWVDAQGCDCITPILLHEAYEAATDQDSADCCNGQNGGNGYGYNYNAACNQKFGSNGSVAPWGWYYYQCPNGKFRTHYLAAYPKKGDANACTKLQSGCPMGGTGKTLHADCTNDKECCSGFACKNWVYDPKNDPIKPVCCSPNGGSCSSPTDCCGGSDCDKATQKCTCVAKDAWCINGDECCAGLTCDTMAQKCVTAPPPDAGVDASADGAATSDASAPESEAGDSEYDVPPPGGCSCDTGPRSNPANGWIVIVGAALVWSLRRRRA